jgi:hypothetical protein
MFHNKKRRKLMAFREVVGEMFHYKKRRKLMTNREVGADLNLLPFRVILDILNYIIVGVDISDKNATYELIGRFSHDVTRSIFLVFRSICVYFGNRKELPTSRFFLPYTVRPDQFIFIDTHPMFWYNLIPALELYDPTKIKLREVCICGPRERYNHDRTKLWYYDIEPRLLNSITNLRALQLYNVLLSTDLLTHASEVALSNVHFSAKLIAPQCTVLNYGRFYTARYTKLYTGNGYYTVCTIQGNDSPVVVAPLVEDFIVVQEGRFFVYIEQPELEPCEESPQHIVEWRCPNTLRCYCSRYDVVDLAKIVHLSINIPDYAMHDNMILGELVSLKCLTVSLANCCNVLLPTHRLSVVRVKGDCSFGINTYQCPFCGSVVNFQFQKVSHVHGCAEVFEIYKFKSLKSLYLGDTIDTKSISFVKCEFINAADDDDEGHNIGYSADEIEVVSSTGVLRVECDILRLRDCKLDRVVGNAKQIIEET